MAKRKRRGKPRIAERRLAIVAMGSSYRDYLHWNFDKDQPRNVADDIWTINSMAFVLKSDMAVMMDDVKELEGRRPEYIDRIKTELKGLPILTSRGYDDYPDHIEYPLADVISKFQFKYLNGSVAFALAYAFFKGYRQIILYGCDYMYDNKPGIYERGRGCVEFWIGVGSTLLGANVMIAQHSTLMDSNDPKFYGYREQPKFDTIKKKDGSLKVKHTGWIPAPVDPAAEQQVQPPGVKKK